MSKTLKDDDALLQRLSADMSGRCDATFYPDDGSTPFVCDRTKRHIVHGDSVLGVRAVPAPGGAWMTKKGGKKP